MASAEQLKALIKSHLNGDTSHFYSVAMQMAAIATAAQMPILIAFISTPFAPEQVFTLESAETGQTG